MKKFYPLFCYLFFITSYHSFAQTSAVESRMNEVFQVTELTAPSGTNGNTRFYDPWEVTYGPDDSLWITEAKNYRVYKMAIKWRQAKNDFGSFSGKYFYSIVVSNYHFLRVFRLLHREVIPAAAHHRVALQDLLSIQIFQSAALMCLFLIYGGLLKL